MKKEIKEIWTLSEIGSILKVPAVREWVSRGYIKPAIPSTSRGIPSRFDYKNVLQFSIMEYLIRRGGFTRQMSSFLISQIGDTDLKRSRVITVKAHSGLTIGINLQPIKMHLHNLINKTTASQEVYNDTRGL